MKRFADYNLTPQEVERMFGNEKRYKNKLSIFSQRHKCDDTEKLKIARILFIRGQRKESLKMIESMEDEKYREDEGRQSYSNWVAWEKGLRI